MFIQIATGTGLLAVNISIAAMAAFLMEAAFERFHRWLIRPPQRPKLMLLLLGTALWVLVIITAAVWVWGLAFWGLGAFPTLEESIYFALVVFTTLGLGDVILPFEWRLLSGMAAANGFLNFGLLTALMVEALRQVRLGQIDHRHHPKQKVD